MSFPQMEQTLRATAQLTLTSFLIPPSISAIRLSFSWVRSR